jgi:hypothetical protein
VANKIFFNCMAMTFHLSLFRSDHRQSHYAIAVPKTRMQSIDFRSPASLQRNLRTIRLERESLIPLRFSVRLYLNVGGFAHFVHTSLAAPDVRFACDGSLLAETRPRHNHCVKANSSHSQAS